MAETEADRTTIYEAFSVLNIDKETTDVYLFLMENGPTPIESIDCISALRKVRAIEILVSNQLVTAGVGGIYSARDAELSFSAKVNALSHNSQTLRKGLDELSLIGSGGSTKPLNTPDEFYEWEDQLFARCSRTMTAVTVRFKLVHLRIPTIEARQNSGVSFKVLGTVCDEETMQRALDLQNAGAEVRHITGATDDMLRYILFDSQSVLFAFRDSDDPTKHIGAWMRNEGFVKPLEGSFEKIWDSAQPAEKWMEFDFS